MAARPQLRGLLANTLKRDFAISVAVAVAGVVGYKFLIQIPRRVRYENYYKNLDTEKEFVAMRDVGIFTSVKPDGTPGDGW